MLWLGAIPIEEATIDVVVGDSGCRWCVVEDVSFRYNLVRNVAAGFNLLGYAIRHANFGMNGAFFTFGNAILNAFYPGYKWEANYLAGATSPGG